MAGVGGKRASRRKSVWVLLNGIVYVSTGVGTGTGKAVVGMADAAVAEVVVLSVAGVVVAMIVTVIEKVGVKSGLLLMLLLLLLPAHAYCASPNQVYSKRAEFWALLKNLVQGRST